MAIQEILQQAPITCIFTRPCYCRTKHDRANVRASCGRFRSETLIIGALRFSRTGDASCKGTRATPPAQSIFRHPVPALEVTTIENFLGRQAEFPHECSQARAGFFFSSSFHTQSRIPTTSKNDNHLNIHPFSSVLVNFPLSLVSVFTNNVPLPRAAVVFPSCLSASRLYPHGPLGSCREQKSPKNSSARTASVDKPRWSCIPHEESK